MRHGNLPNWGILVTGLLALMLVSGKTFADDRAKSAADEAKEKAADAVKKLKDGMKDESENIDDVKKRASEKVKEGKEAWSKKLEDMKAEVEKKKAEAEKKGTSNGNGDGKDNDVAKGGSNNPGKHLGNGNQNDKDDSDSEAADGEENEKQRFERLRRREMGYLMHRRYLDSNENHMKMMKDISDRKGLKVKEQRKHIRRVARLERIRELAVDKNDTAQIAKVDELLDRETQRHESIMVKLHADAKLGQNAEKPEGK